MQISKSLCNTFEYFFERIILVFSNDTAQAAFRTVLQDDGEVFFFVEEKELSGFQDIWMIQGDVKLGFFFWQYLYFFN